MGGWFHVAEDQQKVKKDNDKTKNEKDECCSCDCCETLKKHPLYPTVSQLVHWKDYMRSGLVFLTLNLFFYLITFGGYTLLSLSFYAFFFVLIISLAYTFIQSLKGVKNPLEERFKGSDFSISRETLEKHMEVSHSLCEEVKAHLTDLILCKKMVKSVKAVFTSYLLSVIFGCFNFVTLLWMGTVVAFALPPVYALKKDEIDRHLSIACEQYTAYKNLAMEKLSAVPVLNTFVDKINKSD